ncbi:MAG TPA: glycosyltransferase family 9 protein, partial [Geobacteraceae bacterium]
AIGGTALDRTMEVQPLTDRVRADRIAADLADAGRVVGFQVGASHSYNMWPIDCFIQLAERILADDLEVTIVVTGIDRERPLGERLVQACGKRVLNLCGSYGIADLPYLIRRFSLLVTGDTGPMHLAIAMKVPTISLFSAADPRFTGPYQDAGLHRVIRKDGSFIKSLPKKQRDDSAMRLIPVDEVFAAYEESMRR